MTIFEEAKGKTPEQFARLFISRHKDTAAPQLEQIIIYLEAREKVNTDYWTKALNYIKANPWRPPLFAD